MATVSSLAWGNTSKNISQAYGNTGYRPDWYQYSGRYGHAPGVHIGTDVSMECGTKIYALNDGTVKQSGFSNSFRPYPVHIITDVGGIEEIYGHLQQAFVSTNQKVKRGQLIGYSGRQTVMGTTTPDGTGCHLHFEVRKPDTELTSGWRAIDSTAYLGGVSGTPDLNGVPLQNGIPGIGSFDPTATIQLVGGSFVEFGRRMFLVLAGVVALFIGLNAVLDGSISPAKLVRRTPQGRIAKVAVNAAT